MEELLQGTIIKLEDGNNYIVVDSVELEKQEYIFLITEEESNEEKEEIYALKNFKNQDGEFCLSTISEDEYNDVIALYYDIYKEAGILENDVPNYGKLFDSMNNEQIMENAKRAVYSRIELEKENNKKMVEAKKLVQENQKLIESYKQSADEYKKKVDELAEYNTYLNNKIGSMPKFIRKFFLKMDDTKYLK